MTAASARPLALVPASSSQPAGDRVERVRELLRPEFLAEVWRADGEVFAPPRDHPLLGLRKCAVIDCEAGIRSPGADLCKVCIEKFKASRLTMAEFTVISSGKSRKDDLACRVPDCPRPSRFRVRLCYVHYTQWRGARQPVEDFTTSPDVGPLPSFGECLVASCSREADGKQQLCAAHRRRWLALAGKHEPGTDFERWLAVEEPVNLDYFVVFKGLPEQVQLELLLGLQVRSDAGARTSIAALRPVVAVLRRTQAATVDDLDETLIKQGRHDASALARHLLTAVQRATTSPDEEQRNDVWDLAVLGLGGSLRFTGISQAWLRERAKQWAAEDIPRHRGRQAAHTAKGVVAALGELSVSLRHARDDHGEDPGTLGRRDITELTNRLAHQQRTGQVSEQTRLHWSRALRRFLADIRAMGLTRPGGTAGGLPDDFIMGRHDIPPEPDPDEQGRDLPAWVMQVLDASLHALEERSGTDMRRMTELVIDTGRRPDETAEVITSQQADVRARRAPQVGRLHRRQARHHGDRPRRPAPRAGLRPARGRPVRLPAQLCSAAR